MIKLGKVFYVVSKDETTLFYTNVRGRRVREESFSFKGKLGVVPTEHNLLNLLHKNGIIKYDRADKVKKC